MAETDIVFDYWITILIFIINYVHFKLHWKTCLLVLPWLLQSQHCIQRQNLTHIFWFVWKCVIYVALKKHRRRVFSLSSLLLQRYTPAVSEQQLCDDISQGSEQYWKDVCELNKISWFVWFYCLHPSRICASCEGIYHVGGKENDCKQPYTGWLKSYFPLKQAWTSSYTSFGDKSKHQLSRMPSYTSLLLVIAFRNSHCVAPVRVPGRLSFTLEHFSTSEVN